MAFLPFNLDAGEGRAAGHSARTAFGFKACRIPYGQENHRNTRKDGDMFYFFGATNHHLLRAAKRAFSLGDDRTGITLVFTLMCYCGSDTHPAVWVKNTFIFLFREDFAKHCADVIGIAFDGIAGLGTAAARDNLGGRVCADAGVVAGLFTASVCVWHVCAPRLPIP